MLSITYKILSITYTTISITYTLFSTTFHNLLGNFCLYHQYSLTESTFITSIVYQNLPLLPVINNTTTIIIYTDQQTLINARNCLNLTHSAIVSLLAACHFYTHCLNRVQHILDLTAHLQ